MMDAIEVKRIVDELNSFSYLGSDLESSHNPQLSIVLVNWKTKDLLKQCLNSIYKNTKRVSYEIIVVDNNSSDGSVELVRENFFRVTLIANDANLGHAKAMNQAVGKCSGEYILFLNPDTIILNSALDTLIDFMKSQPDVGAITPKILGLDGVMQKGCRRLRYTAVCLFFNKFGFNFIFPKSNIFGRHYMTCFDENTTMEVDIISGVCMLIRKKTLGEVGLFDEKFYLLIEDIDMSYRIKEARWKIYYVPAAEIIHYHGESTKQRGDIREKARSEYFYFYRKHYSLYMAIFDAFLRFVTIPLQFVYYRLTK
jgi:GT2 family glycosyltransferase